MEKVLKTIAAGIGAVAAYLWGPLDVLIIVLIAVVAIDYVTGIIRAWYNKALNSQVGFKGLAKKVAIFMIIALGALLDKAVPATNGAIRAAVCLFYIANEGLSILENAGDIGLPMPSILKKALVQIREKADPPEDDIEE